MKKIAAIIILCLVLIPAAVFFSCFALIEGSENADEHKIWLCPVSAKVMTYDYTDACECRPVYYTPQVDKMVNLRELWLKGDDMENDGNGYSVMNDFSFLGKMPHLENLTLDFDKTSDYTTLPSMPSLRRLTMYAAPASVFPDDFAAKAPELKYMRIGRSDNIDKLAGLDSLEYLNIQINEGGNIYGIEKLASLKELRMEIYPDTDLSPLGECSSLESLWISLYDGGKTVLSPIAECKSLKELHLYCGDCDIPELDFFRECENLERVCIPSGNERILAFIGECPRLKDVSVGNYYYDFAGYNEKDGLLLRCTGKITDTSFLAKRGDVRTAEIWADEITDYSGLLEMPSLEKLRVNLYIKELSLYNSGEMLEEYRNAFREQEKKFAENGIDAEIRYCSDNYGQDGEIS